MSYRYVNNSVLGYYPSKHLADGEILKENLLEGNFKGGEFCYQIGRNSLTSNEHIIWGDVKCGMIEREDDYQLYDEEDGETYNWVVLKVDGIVFTRFNTDTQSYQNSEWERKKKVYLVIFKEVTMTKYKEINIHNIDLEDYDLQELKLIARSRGVRVTKGITKEKLIHQLDKDFRERMFNLTEHESFEEARRSAKQVACDKDSGFCGPQALAHAMGIPVRTLNNFLVHEGFRQRGEGMDDELILWAANHFGFTLKDRTKEFEKFVRKTGKYSDVQLYKTNLNVKRPRTVCCNLFHFKEVQEFFNPRVSYLIFSTEHVSAVVYGQLYDLVTRDERIERVVEFSKPKVKRTQETF